MCTGCDRISFPPRPRCPGCGGRAWRATALVSDGTIETLTVIHSAPAGFGDDVPYAIAIIKLDDGVRLTAQVADCVPDTLQIGDRVRRAFRRLGQDRSDGLLHYGYKYVPIERRS